MIPKPSMIIINLINAHNIRWSSEYVCAQDSKKGNVWCAMIELTVTNDPESTACAIIYCLNR